jgi:hypothetical protein
VTAAPRTRLILCATIACAAVAAGEAAAQPALGSGRFEVSAGAGVVGTQTYGSVDANETTATGGAFRLFSTSSELGSAPGLDARVGVRVAGTLVVEADLIYTRPELRIATSSDVESAANVTASEPLRQYAVGGGATWYVPTTNRVVPFVAGGGGYLRQLHDRALLVDTGRYYQFGGGVVYLLSQRPGAAIKATGVRVDARAVVFKDGVALDGGTHVAPSFSGSFVVRF